VKIKFYLFIFPLQESKVFMRPPSSSSLNNILVKKYIHYSLWDIIYLSFKFEQNPTSRFLSRAVLRWSKFWTDKQTDCGQINKQTATLHYVESSREREDSEGIGTLLGKFVWAWGQWGYRDKKFSNMDCISIHVRVTCFNFRLFIVFVLVNIFQNSKKIM